MTSNKLSLTIALAAALAGGCVENDTESLELLVTGGVEGITGLETTVPSNSLPLGSTQTLEAVAKRSDGTLLTLSEVSWSSDNQAIVSVNNTGEITAVSVGTADVSYEYLNQVSTVSIDVTPATMQAIAFTPATLTMHECSETMIGLQAVYSDGTTQTPSATPAWTLSDPSIASLKTDEQTPASVTVKAIESGTTTLSGSIDDISNSLEIVVTDSLAAISVEEAVINVETGGDAYLAVSGSYTDDTVVSIDQFISLRNESTTAGLQEDGLILDTPGVDHSTDTESEPQLITLLSTPHAVYSRDEDNQLIVTATAAGVDMLSIECGGLATPLEVQINDPVVLTSVSIDSNFTEISAGESVQLEATSHFSDGSIENLEDADWEVIAGDTDKFSLDTDSGEVSADVDIVVERSITIRLESEGFEDEITIYAEKGAIEEAESLAIYFTDTAGNVTAADAGTPLSLTAGDELKLNTEITFNTGRAEFATQGIFWSNADPDIAVVNAQGTVTAVSAGLTSVTAVDANGLTATVYVLVAPPSTTAEEQDTTTE
jgi:hypothetical protein